MATEQQEQKVDIGAQFKKWTIETQLVLNELDKINSRLDKLEENMNELQHVCTTTKSILSKFKQELVPPMHMCDNWPTMEDFDRDEEAELAEAKKNATNEWKISMEVENKLKEAYDQLYKQRMRMLKNEGVL